jgi:hypothetical protein
MTKAIKHIVEIHIQNIQGIHVFDRKLPHQEGQGGPRGLNKISAIASIRRNKNVTTSGTSYPLQPSSNLQSSNGSYLYHANWNHSDAKDTSSRIALQTNLHPLPKQQQQKKNKNIMYLFDQQQQVNTNKFEPKRFDVVIGLKRGNEFVVLATSLIHIDKEMANEEMTLPLIPIMATTSRNKSRTKGDHPHDDLTTAFADDENRYFSLDAGAVLHCSVSVSCHDTWHKKLHMERMMSQKMSLFYDEDDTTVPKMNEKKEVLLQTNNPGATNGDVTEEREYFSRDHYNDDYREHNNTTNEDSGYDTYVGCAQSDTSNQHESEDVDDKKIESEDTTDHESAHMTTLKKSTGHVHVDHHEKDDISSILFCKDQEKASMESEESAEGQRNVLQTHESFSQPKQNDFPENHLHQKRRNTKLMKFAQHGLSRISKSLRVISDRGLTIFESSSDPDDDDISDLYEENVFECIAVAAKRFSTIAMETDVS